MSNSSFGVADFNVMADQRGLWPLPERDADGVPHYRATVKTLSETEYKNLQNNVSLVTMKRGLGGFDFVASVEAGPSSATLQVPIMAGELQSFTALLVSVTPKMSGRKANHFECVCDWLILSSDITP